MRTEQEAPGTGQLTKDGTARPTPPLRTRLAELVGRAGQRLWGPSTRATPVAIRPVSDDEQPGRYHRNPATTSGRTPFLAAGAALAIMGWHRRSRSAGGNA